MSYTIYMLYVLTLGAHIFVALLTMATIAAALWAMVKNHSHIYKRIGVFLAMVAAVQVASGFILIALSPELSVMKVGFHLALYLAACFLVEAALVVKARKPAWTS